MLPTENNPLLAWTDNPRARRAVVALLAVLVLVEGYFAIFTRQNDVLIHRSNGQDFINGNPYREAAREIYPVGRSLMNVVLAIGPLYLTRAFAYALAVLALYACYRSWRKLAEKGSYERGADIPVCSANGRQECLPHAAALAGLGTLVLASPFVLRDLDECGMQTFVLFFLSAAGLALARGKKAWSGFWLATAAVYKVSPVLFLPFLLWKRQWRAAAWMGVFMAVWFVAPAVWLGWDTTAASHAKWLARAAKIASLKAAYPYQGELEPPQVYNLSLAAFFARYLETYPPDHPLYLDQPGFVQFGDLDALTAYYVVRGTMLALALALAWRFRRAWSSPTRGSDFAAEWSAVCLLSALASPVCWKQHMVLMLPALFLSLHALLKQPSRWRFAALALIGVVFLGTKTFALGKDWSQLALSYKIDTVAALLLLLLVLTLPRRDQLAQTTAHADATRPLADAA